MAKEQLYWEDVKEEDEIPSFSLKIDETRIVKQVSGSQDFYPVHHDREFARAGGHPDIFVNTGFMRACFGRLITSWIGDDGFLRKFTMQMRKMNRPGDTMTLKGKVVRKYSEDGNHLVECDVWAENDREGITTPSSAIVILPSRG
ncbi:MAG: MaoC/PaaZ C-terminal domain-containing protein [Dehalococcoidia bacterium]|nr:MaoC/PaaZ C-terminal domain-containing protein [Dehalococcoidia bacterium]